MESRLPKPSGLRRPTPLSKSILPMDRIKQSGVTAFNKFGISGVNGNANTHTSAFPLSRDLTNLQGTCSYTRGRAVSPDLDRHQFSARGKIRRSKSACDIREIRKLKRIEPTLAPIPCKAPRFLSSTTIAESNACSNIALRAGLASLKVGSTVAPVKKISKPNIGIGNKLVATKKPISTTPSTTGAGKTINKRIPPYDFKARYNDLLEKHKILKEKFEEAKNQLLLFENLPEEYEEAQAQLFKTIDELRNVKTEKECLERQISSETMKVESLTKALQTTSEEYEKLREINEKVTAEKCLIEEEAIDLRERTTHLTAENSEMFDELTLLKDQVFRLNMERKDLHNTVIDLRGNIRVFCRVRPPLDCEELKALCGWHFIDESTLEIQNPDLNGTKNKSSHTFTFDHVFHPRSMQEDVFEMVSPLIQSALDGYNICIFAYGQTGSGKTYTMDGLPSNLGVIPRTVDLLFDSVENYKRLGWSYEIKVTFLEIYNEVLYDLLSNEQKDMEIRMTKSNKNDIYVSNITEETVSSANRLRHLMNIAKMNRATASTAANDRSSRSHAVTKIELIGTHEEKTEICIGSINLVDLAGSESPKTSIRMNETKNINRSLSELTNVILALLQKQDHIPYRNSKLTHLLMPSLGGNSKTLMFINVAPFQDCFVESLKSLRFAASVNSCKVAKAKKNKFLNTSTGGPFS